MRNSFAATCVLVTLVATALIGLRTVAGPTTAPAKAAEPAAADPLSNEPVVTDLRVLEFPETNYLYFATETTLREMGPIIEGTMRKLQTARREHDIETPGY